MDLWCTESVDEIQQQGQPVANATIDGLPALPDLNLLADCRVLERLLFCETRCTPPSAQFTFQSIQQDITPDMRKQLASWMLEVCQELQCENIFPLAMNYVDRFLGTSKVDKSHLQLLGAVCLMIASKLRQCKSIHPEELVFFTDHSVTVHQVNEWELLVLTTLKWDMSAVVSLDFLDHLLARLHLMLDKPCSRRCKETVDEIRRFATDLCLMISKEADFVDQSPSLVAAAALSSAVTALRDTSTNSVTLDKFNSRLAEVTGIPASRIKLCQDAQLIAIADTVATVTLRDSSKYQTLQHSTSSSSSSSSSSLPSQCLCAQAKSVINSYLDKPETPTDLQDVIF